MKKINLIRRIDNYLDDKKFSFIYKNNKLDIINYDEILDFNSSKISIRYKDIIYYIEGNNLVISRMMENEILITGNIIKITIE